MSRTSFADQVHQMWRTRPVRLPRQGPIAGVSAGFGLRYGVDPVLVRVAFVVSTIFGGAGVVLYLLAWLVLGSANDGASAAESLSANGRGTHSQTKTIVLIVALAIAVSTMGPIGLGLGGSGVFSMGLMLAGWWMLYLRHPELPAGFDSYRAPVGATGYPGAGYPTSAHGYPYTPEVPPTGVYTPYTRLPDTYAPDPATTVLPREETPAAETGGAAAESAPLLRVDETETVTDAPRLSKADDFRLDDIAEPEDAGRTGADESDSTGGEAVSAEQTAVDADATETIRLEKGSTTESPTAPSVTASVDLDKHEADSPKTVEDDATAILRKDPQRPEKPSSTPRPRLGAQVPSGWDPLAVAPLAWELPDTAPRYAPVAPTQPKRPRSRLTPITIGLAILAAAVAGAVAASGAEWMTPARIGAVALTVVALGLIVGAFLRRGYGLLMLTAPLAGFVLLASLIGPIDFEGNAMGERTWTPASVAELQPNYTMTMGSATLDLRELALTEPKAVELSVNMAEGIVLLPEGMRVHTTCDIRAGDATRCDEGLTGPDNPDAPVLDLRVVVRMGSVEVTRG
ncbi:PspC domain-containing protein [Nocardia halotolerans]|uniref:PspC domain-containing protein n=1 Tax=Nocardia halotolerans TaxID=1755878 RepID=A0ABV8VNA9_9NOCA